MANITQWQLDFSSSYFIIESHAYNYFTNADLYALSPELACWSDCHHSVIHYYCGIVLVVISVENYSWLFFSG